MASGLSKGVPAGLLGLGPNVIGGTGGSGTRVIARIARRGGLYIGEDLNQAEDARQLGAWGRRWIDPYLALRSVERDGIDRPEVRARMHADLDAVLRLHCRAVERQPRPWGWKTPRSIFLLPFLDERFPALRFVHVIRDGRDVAFSERQGQLVKHGRAVLGAEQEEGGPLASMALWNRVNLDAADYGERRLPGRYLRVRLEDVIARPVASVERILGFLGLEADAEAIAREEVDRPESLGRWRDQDPALLGELDRVGAEALRRFGYADS